MPATLGKGVVQLRAVGGYCGHSPTRPPSPPMVKPAREKPGLASPEPGQKERYATCACA